MADFDEKLNQILSNPDAMAQIARLAQSLNAPPPASNSGNVTPPGTQSRAAPPSAQSSNAAPPVTDSGAAAALLSDAAQSRHAPPPDASGDTFSASNVPPAVPDAPHVPPAADNTIARFLPLLQELGGDSDARRLLYALRPYLRPQKQEKVERALHLARLFRVGKKFLSQWEG